MAINLQTSADPLRLVIADPHPGTRTALRMLFGDEPGIRVVACVGDALATVRAVRTERPHVILVDQRLLDAPGLPALGTLAEMAGGAAVVVMGIDEGRAYVDAARRLGAVDYVVKLAPLDDWVSAVCAARRR